MAVLVFQQVVMAETHGQKIFGAKLRRLREEAGFGQAAFAALIPLAKSYLSEQENSSVTTMNRDKFRALANKLNLTVEQLRERIGAPDDAQVKRPRPSMKLKLSKDQQAALAQIAEAENRPLAQVASDLIGEAIAARNVREEAKKKQPRQMLAAARTGNRDPD